MSLPATADGNTGRVERVCAKVVIKPTDITGTHEMNLSATVIEHPNGNVSLMMGKSADHFGPRCDGSFVPFPELEALGVKR